MPEGGFRTKFPILTEESAGAYYLHMSTLMEMANVNPESAGNPTSRTHLAFMWVSSIMKRQREGEGERVEGH